VRARAPRIARTVAALVLVVCLEALTSCHQASVTPARRLDPTVEIRHRDAYPLMLTLDDLGVGYSAAETTRLARGKGWTDETTRLSGYRAAYRGTRTVFADVECQVECYLSVRDGQSAYRALKEQLSTQVHSQGTYTSVNESETSLLGEWGWLFHLRTQDQETFLYLFVRENVLVEALVSGAHSAELADQAIRLAQVIDQRVMAR
jgi:hypothetical protein